MFYVVLWSLLLLSTLIRGDGEYWGSSDDDPALREGTWEVELTSIYHRIVNRLRRTGLLQTPNQL